MIEHGNEGRVCCASEVSYLGDKLLLTFHPLTHMHIHAHKYMSEIRLEKKIKLVFIDFSLTLVKVFQSLLLEYFSSLASVMLGFPSVSDSYHR